MFAQVPLDFVIYSFQWFGGSLNVNLQTEWMSVWLIKINHQLCPSAGGMWLDSRAH